MADISKINLGGVEYDIRDQKLKEDVEKKADKTYVDEEAERVVGYAEEVADNAEKAAKKYADDNKVAKVEGKQLSTEDFTTALKQKLEGLTNYDDADVRSAITELQNNLDAIVNGDATSAIDSIQEILAFLSTITDTQTLAGIVADLKQYVDDKVASGGSGGITEEKEVYIGSEEPPVGAKVWIDPTGTPSQPSQPSEGNKPVIFYYPHQVQDEMRDITPEQKAVNAQSYLQVTNALKNGLMPNILIPYSEILAAKSLGISGGYGGSIPSHVLYIAPDSPLSEVYGGAFLTIAVANEVMNSITIWEDGTASTN